ncbi:MAG TPA: hypothetical protein VHE12_03740 [bacterium]|nr:hypothetical protein [bacterium]
MPYRTKAEKRNDHLYFGIEGDFEVGGLGAVLDELINEVAAVKAERVLIDVREVMGAPDIWERFQFATLFATRYLAARAKDSIPPSHFALLGQEPLLDPKRFGEKVAQNRGLSVRVFLTEPEALEWLRSA